MDKMMEKENHHRRSGDFIERLSIILVMGSFVGAFIVLFDVKLALVIYGQSVTVGSGFAPETKGMVLQSMLITALSAVVAFWYGTTKQGQDQAQSVSKIAESAAPTTALAVAAARTDPAPQVPAVLPVPTSIDTQHMALVAFEEKMAAKYGKDWYDSMLSADEMSEYEALKTKQY